MDQTTISAILNSPVYGFPLYKVLIALAALAALAFVLWLVAIIGIWRSSMSVQEKLLASVLIIAIGPFEAAMGLALHVLIEWPISAFVRLFRGDKTGAHRTMRVRR